MSANFTPSLEAYKETGSFKFWCNKVLPLVYDDSLSYYETLCKVVNYLNDVIANVDGLHVDVTNLLFAYNQLQGYVNDYFDNLDVQNEINKKLDDMADDGSLSELLSPIVATQIGGVVAEQIDNVVSEQIDGSVGRQIDESVSEQIGTPAANATTAWLNENVTPVGSAVIVDNSLSIRGAAADAKVTGDKIIDLTNAIDISNIPISKVLSWNIGYVNNVGTIMNSTQSKYCIVQMYAGETVTIGTANNNIGIISIASGASAGVGDTVQVVYKTTSSNYEEYTYEAKYTQYVCLCVLAANYNVEFTRVTKAQDNIDDLFENGYINIDVTTNGSAGANGLTNAVANRIRTDLIILNKGDTLSIDNGTFQHACIAWVDSVSSANCVRNDNSFSSNDETIVASQNTLYVVIFKKSDNSNIVPSNFDGGVSYYPKTIGNVAITSEPFFKSEEVSFDSGLFYNISTHQIDNDSDYKLAKINVAPFRGSTIKGVTACSPTSRYGVAFVDNNEGFIVGYANPNVGNYTYPYELTVPDNATYFYVSLRVASSSVWVAPMYNWDNLLLSICAGIPQNVDVVNDVVTTKLLNGRHVLSGNNTPLTLLHFSDLHSDKAALYRITKYGNGYGSNVDDMICTGDMVAGSAAEIDSWWNEKVLTCIGNHDTCSYSGGVYDWTALSMADRDAYYIAPFESNWDITHTSGTSYYYKDYSEQKVRLIVMDGMLYVDNGAEATTQTNWLDGLLASAISGGLHVIIAIHAPHGGSTARECSFSRYNQGTMPVLGDCDTPQSVIDTVSARITGGLNFIGYLCGHTHQDNIWDAVDSGRQLMYCVTCAAVSQTAQWLNGDMYRDERHDAFNLVCIDTSRTLVKIIRGGGADVDDHMRTRKAICFDYSSGVIVGDEI